MCIFKTITCSYGDFSFAGQVLIFLHIRLRGFGKKAQTSRPVLMWVLYLCRASLSCGVRGDLETVDGGRERCPDLLVLSALGHHTVFSIYFCLRAILTRYKSVNNGEPEAWDNSAGAVGGELPWQQLLGYLCYISFRRPGKVTVSSLNSSFCKRRRDTSSCNVDINVKTLLPLGT